MLFSTLARVYKCYLMCNIKCYYTMCVIISDPLYPSVEVIFKCTPNEYLWHIQYSTTFISKFSNILLSFTSSILYIQYVIIPITKHRAPPNPNHSVQILQPLKQNENPNLLH